MEADEDDDMHMCLVCHTTIKGIINYVAHKKSECVGKKGVKGEVQQALPTQSPSTNEARNVPVPYLPQKYSHNQQFDTDFTEFRAASSSHNSIIDFETGHFDTQNVDGVNKASSLDNVLYSGPHDKAGTLFDPQVTTASMDITNPQSNLEIPVPTSLNLSPSIFRPEHASLTGTELHEDHGLLDGCITSEHIDSGFSTGIVYPGLNSNTVQTTNSSTIIMSDIIPNTSNKEEYNQNRNASEKVDDFFQSLELMSKNDPRAEKGAGFGQPLANLPISNILSNLTFSSDEEEFSFDFADDVSFDSLSDDSDVGSKTVKFVEPIESSSVRNRPRFRGKWPPGQGPAVSTPRQHQKQSKGGKKFPPETFKKTVNAQGKLKQHSQIKPFTCSICDLEFSCRFKYSNHFGTPQHKQNLQNRRSERMETRRPFKSGRGKSFKLIREVNKQFEDDPFSQPFATEKSDSVEKGADTGDEVIDVIVDNKDTKDSLHNCSKEKMNAEREDANLLKLQNEQKSALPDIDANDTESAKIKTDENVRTDVKIHNVVDQGNADDETHAEKNNDETLGEEDSTNQLNDLEPMYRAVPLYICTICDKKYPNKYYLSRHLITKSHRNKALNNPEEGFYLLQLYHKYIIRLSPYQCAICRFYFNNYSEFLKHLESLDHAETQESIVAEMICSLCSYRTHYNEDLLEHVKSEEHINIIGKKKKICIIKESHVKCKCKYCGLVMNSYTRLKRHVILKHKDKEYISGVVKKQIGVRNRPNCAICSQQFASVSTLELHMRRRHTRIRPYKCLVCCKEFSDKYAFKGHQRTSRHLKRVLASKEIKKDNNALKEEKKATISADDSVFQISEIQSGIKIENNAVEWGLSEPKDGHEHPRDTINLRDADSIKKQTYDILGIAAPQESDDTNVVKSSQKSDTDWVPRSQRIKIKLATKVKENVGEKKKKRNRRKPTEPVSIKDKTYKCNHCSFTVTAYNDLRPHYLKEHAAQTTICELCDIVFLSDKAMKLHILSKEHQQNISTSSQTAENNVKYFECHICKKKFTDEKYCKFHTAYQHFHITTEDGVMKEFGEKSVTREKYKDVLAEMEQLPHTSRIECPECKVSFKKPNFLEHLRLHTGEKPFKCKMCPKAFMANVTLRKHLLGHFGCLERTCEVCNKHFKKASSYEEHKKVHEAEKASAEKMHVCDTCGLSFYLARQLQNHIRRHKDREFKCTVPGCHWKFLFANELKYHMRSHSQLKPFLCDICGYSATSKCRLTRHHRTHTGERNYHCEYCSYKAGNSTHLHRHMRIHIGSKPFKCPYCEYSCNTHENMRKHIVQTKKHVGLKIYPCRFCEYATNSCADFRNHLMEKHESDLGTNTKLMNGLSKFTGLYNKELDPKQPKEGNKIHQVRERIPRVKKSTDDPDSSARKKDKSKGKNVKMAKQQNTSKVILMDAHGNARDVAAILSECEINSIVKENTAVNSNVNKVNPDFDDMKPVDGRHQAKSHVNSAQDRFNVISQYGRQSSHTEPKSEKSEGKVNTVMGSNYTAPGQIPINGCYADSSSARNLTFGHAYAVYASENAQKQTLMNINTPINYRSLLKTGTIANMPSYQAYNAYSDHQQLHGTSAHDYNGPFAGNQAQLYPGNRGEPVGLLPENLHRNEASVAAYSSYSGKRLRPNIEDRDQTPGNLIIDMEFEKKHLNH